MHPEAVVFTLQMEWTVWSFQSSLYCRLRKNEDEEAWYHRPYGATVSQVVSSGPRVWCRPARCYCSLAHSGRKPCSTLKAWPLSQLFCPSRGSEILGEAQLASVWVFLLLHAWQGGLPLPGLDLWNVNLASHQRGRGGQTFGRWSPSVRIASSLVWCKCYHSLTQSFSGAWTKKGKDSRIIIYSTTSWCIWWTKYFGSWASKAPNMQTRWQVKLLIISIIVIIGLICIILGPHWEQHPWEHMGQQTCRHCWRDKRPSRRHFPSAVAWRLGPIFERDISPGRSGAGISAGRGHSEAEACSSGRWCLAAGSAARRLMYDHRHMRLPSPRRAVQRLLEMKLADLPAVGAGIK